MFRIICRIFSQAISLFLAFAGPVSAADIAVLIGNQNYNSWGVLATPHNDVDSVGNLLEERFGFEVQVEKDLTSAEMLQLFSSLQSRLTEDDRLILYFAGHGIVQEGEGFWIGIDGQEDSEVGWIPNSTITRKLRSIAANDVLLVVDSCYSGTILRSRGGATESYAGEERREWLSRMVQKKSRWAFVSGGMEPVVDSDGGSNSVFARYFLSALRETNDVTEASQLYHRVKVNVSNNANQTPDYQRVYRSGDEGGEFVLIPTVVTDEIFSSFDDGSEIRNALKLRGAASDGDNVARSDQVFWNSISNATDAIVFRAYLQTFPDGIYVNEAMEKIRLFESLAPENNYDVGDLTGAWTGAYFYPEANRPQVPFEMKLVQSTDKTSIFGRSSEPNTFGRSGVSLLFGDINGHVDGDTVTWTKTYDGTGGADHSVFYSGKIDWDQNLISGEWDIDGYSGKFMIVMN